MLAFKFKLIWDLIFRQNTMPIIGFPSLPKIGGNIYPHKSCVDPDRCNTRNKYSHFSRMSKATQVKKLIKNYGLLVTKNRCAQQIKTLIYSQSQIKQGAFIAH